MDRDECIPGARPVVIRGVRYPCARAAADALGVAMSTIYTARSRGTLGTVGIGRGRRPRMPVRIRGRLYPDIDAAAAALGVSESAIRRAADRGTLDRVGLPRRAPCHARAVTIGGLRFRSMVRASLELGLSRDYVRITLKERRPHQVEKLMNAAMRLRAARESAAARRAGGRWAGPA